MITEDEQKLVQQLANVFEDLQSFLIQKNHQQIIYAFLQIKRMSRKGTASSNVSVDRKSIASVSQKNYSQRKKSVNDNSAKKSVGKQSHASFDIIKGAEFFNQSRKNKPHYQKQYTQASRYQRPYMQNQNQQQTRFTGPYISNNDNQVLHRNNNTPQIVPKLVGLVSSDEISDIERPSGRSARNRQARGSQRTSENRGLNYDRSIVEVQDDDDQFEDVVLNRLDKIQEKVNQMLKDKKKQRLQQQAGNGNLINVQPRPPMTPTHNYTQKTRLQNVNSGPNIIHTHQNMHGHRNSEFYKYQQPRYNVSSDQMMPNSQMYTFQNTKNNSYIGLTNKRLSDLSNGMRPQQFTERAHKLSSRILAQLPNYVTDNQQYGDQYQRRPYRPEGLGVREAQTMIVYEQNLPQDIVQQNMLIKNKRLGHYRDSSGTIRLTTQGSQQNRPSYSRVQQQQMVQKQAEYSRLRQQAFIDGENVYKYIPMVRGVPEKTQRHVITRKTDRKGDNKSSGQEIYEHHRVGKVVFIDKSGRQIVNNNSNRFKQQSYSQHIPQARDDLYYKSTKNSGIRQRPLQGSNIKAYTQHGDFIPSADDFSVSSDGGIYSEIRELRQLTKNYGGGKGDRRESYKNRNIGDKDRLIVQRQYRQQFPQQQNIVGQDYRYHQKTQRNRYVPSQKYSQHSGEDYDGEVIIQRGPVEQRVYRVVREVPNYVQRQQVPVNNRKGSYRQSFEGQQYVEFVPVQEQTVYRTVSQKGSVRSNQPVYVVRQNSQGYEKVQQKSIPHIRKQKQSQFRTIAMKDDNRSQKRYSTGSINTFKSIPYRQDSRKNTLKQMMEQDKNVEYVQSHSNHEKEQQNQQQEV